MIDIPLDELLRIGRSLLDDGDGLESNPEYARAIAEFIVEITPSLNQNSHRDAILALLDLRPS